MNKWIRLGLVVVASVILLKFSFGILGWAMKLISVLFPIALLAGAGLVIYGIVRGSRKSLGSGYRGYLDE